MISIGCFESTKSRSSSATFSLRIAGARGTHFFLLCSYWWRLGNMHSVALRSARVSESDSCWKAPVCTWPSRVPNEFPFCAFHKPFRTKTLNQPVPFLDSPLIQLAAAVNKVLMSSTAILLSQCFLTEVSFFEDFCKDRRRKTFLFFFFFSRRAVEHDRAAKLSTTDCEMHRDGLDPSHLLFSSCTCGES